MAPTSLRVYRKQLKRPNSRANWNKFVETGVALWPRRFFLFKLAIGKGTEGEYPMRVLILSACLAVLTACGGGGETGSDPVEPETQATPISETPEPVIDPTGETCGGIAGLQCPAGYYCEQAPGECVEVQDGAGTCQPRPEVCTREYMPVCGCDGQTYGNACDAASNGVSVAFEGECASPDTE